MKVLLNIFLLIVFFTELPGQKIQVRIFSGLAVKTFIFSPVVGKYEIIGDTNVVCKLHKNDAIYITLINDSIYVKDLQKQLGVFSQISINGLTTENYAKLKPVIPASDTRIYDDDFFITPKDDNLLIINSVDLEDYVSGVVESEGGQKENIEYYKTQSILCRTYALENLGRHKEEGYNLCDGVHCQAYYGKSLSNFNIIEATELTAGLIIVDTNLNLITATFHSNCGGQTAASQDVWLKPHSYLQSSIDTFCTKSRNAKWQQTISLSDWIKYLKLNGIRIQENTFRPEQIEFEQPFRKTYYKIGTDSIALKKIRADWNLRSTFFNVSVVNNSVILNGRGYGHGVGLCQEGAMEMARQGFTYQQIIKYYYANTFVVSLRALNFFRENK